MANQLFTKPHQRTTPQMLRLRNGRTTGARGTSDGEVTSHLGIQRRIVKRKLDFVSAKGAYSAFGMCIMCHAQRIDNFSQPTH
jgi:hypothetical protein